VVLIGRLEKYKSLVGTPKGMIALRRLNRRADNIKVDLEEIVCEGVDWIHLAQGMAQCRGFLNTVMAANFLTAELLLASRNGPRIVESC
jgi:hypothetical protein